MHNALHVFKNKILSFYPEFFDHVGTRIDLTRKLRLILKSMASQTGQQIITIIILPIS